MNGSAALNRFYHNIRHTLFIFCLPREAKTEFVGRISSVVQQAGDAVSVKFFTPSRPNEFADLPSVGAWRVAPN
jgi:hypothetical protein